MVWWLLAAAEAAALVVVAPRLWRAARGAHRLVAGGDVVGAGSISVVIPARNEAARIADCLAALRGAPGVLEVIVVDDESSDATAQIAEQCGATVVRTRANECADTNGEKRCREWCEEERLRYATDRDQQQRCYEGERSNQHTAELTPR
ncbi:MAG: glycosyltransferase [Actinobacteria bacterium]|nr:glycosyltransferase [Actinomycetota bacterium]